MDNASQNGQGQPEARMKVWRPQGFAGVEVERFDNVRKLTLVPFVSAGHDMTVVHRSGEFLYRYERQESQLVGDNLYLNQHAGAPCFGTKLDDTPMSVWTLRLYPDAVRQLKTDLGLSQSFSYFPEMMAPAELNDTLAKLTTEAVLAFDTPASTVEREAKLFGLTYAVLKYCSNTPPPEMKLGKEHEAVLLVKDALHAHPEHDHSLKDLSQLAGLSPKYLLGVFARDVGYRLTATSRACGCT